MKTIKDTENKLLKRREIQIVIEASKNPGFVEAQRMIAEQFKAKEDVIVIKKVKGKFGRNTFLVESMIYNSLKDKEMFEQKPRQKKGTEQTPQQIQSTQQAAPAPAVAGAK